MNMQSEKKLSFPTLIDNTQVSTFSACPKKWWLSAIVGLSPKRKSIHLHAGGAFAKALEVARRHYHYQSNSQSDALVEAFKAFTIFWGDFPEDGGGTNKSFDRVWGAVESYFKEYPLTTDYLSPYSPDSGVEYTFSIPLPVEHPETGDPLLYGGRFDLLAQDSRTNAPVICDEKTTTALGSSWPSQWKLSSQFLGYVWAARCAGIEVNRAIIRGIAILKTKYSHLEVTKHYPDFLLKKFAMNLHYKATMMRDTFIAHHKALEIAKERPGYEVTYLIPNSLGEACTAYGGCPYVDICSSENEELWYADFEQKFWNPLEALEPATRVLN